MLIFFPHRKCVIRNKTGFTTKQRKLQYKTGFATKQRKLYQNRFHAKQCEFYSPISKSSYPKFLHSSISLHPKFLHISSFSTSRMSPQPKLPHKISPQTMSVASATNISCGFRLSGPTLKNKHTDTLMEMTAPRKTLTQRHEASTNTNTPTYLG